jgi:hypothetical protein
LNLVDILGVAGLVKDASSSAAKTTSLGFFKLAALYPPLSLLAGFWQQAPRKPVRRHFL